MKATVLYDNKNADYDAAHMAMNSVMGHAGLEQSDFAAADVVFVYAMVDGRAAMKILGNQYTPGKFFFVMCLETKHGEYAHLSDLPPNVWWMSQENILGGNFPDIVKEELVHIPGKLALSQGYCSHLGDAVERVNSGSASVKILVVDDRQVNQLKAMMELGKDHDLTIASSYGQAMELLFKEQFDVVLTDCNLPVSSYHGNDIRCKDIGRLVPYGFLIANEAKVRGARVAIVTDTGHHANDPIGAALHKGTSDPSVAVYNIYKDWRKALSDLGVE